MPWRANSATAASSTISRRSSADIRAVTRAGFKRLWALVERLSGLPFDRVVSFFAMGMLMNVAAAMDLAAVDERWTCWVTGADADGAFPVVDDIPAPGQVS